MRERERETNSQDNYQEQKTAAFAKRSLIASVAPFWKKGVLSSLQLIITIKLNFLKNVEGYDLRFTFQSRDSRKKKKEEEGKREEENEKIRKKNQQNSPNLKNAAYTGPVKRKRKVGKKQRERLPRKNLSFTTIKCLLNYLVPR